MYIASQIFSAISLFFNIWSRFFKKQHHNLFINIFASIFNLISYILLTAYMGMVGLIVSTIRSIVFFFFAKNNWEKKTWLLVLFVVAQFATCVLTACISGFVLIDFILVFLKGSLYTYGSWQHNVNIFRWSSIISSTVAIIYNLLHAGYINCASELLSIVILFYVIIRDVLESKKQLKPLGDGNIKKVIIPEKFKDDKLSINLIDESEGQTKSEMIETESKLEVEPEIVHDNDENNQESETPKTN